MIREKTKELLLQDIDNADDIEDIKYVVKRLIQAIQTNESVKEKIILKLQDLAK